MEISIPLEPELLTTNVVDNTPHYSQQAHIKYQKGLRLQDANEVWEWSTQDMLPIPYVDADKLTYKTGDILWAKDPVDDGYGKTPTTKVQGVIHVAGSAKTDVPKQPDLYKDVDGVFSNYSGWSHRYALVESGLTGDFTGFTKDSGKGAAAHTHRLFKSKGSPTGWTYEVVKHIEKVPYWNDSVFSVPDKLHPNIDKNYILVTFPAGASDAKVDVWFEGKQVVDQTNVGISSIVPYSSTIDGTAQGNPYMGKPFLFGDLMRTQQDSAKTTYRYYRVSSQAYKTVDVIASDHAVVHDFIAPDTIEPRSYYSGVTLPTPPPPITPAQQTEYTNQKNTNFILRSFVLRGSNLYARTNIDAIQETTNAPTPLLERLDRLRDFKSGWTFVSPVDSLKPFDNKAYTQIKGGGVVTFKVKVNEGEFNTIAFTKLIAESVDVMVVANNTQGSVLLDLKNFKPDGKRDINSRLPDVGTTAIVYSGIQGESYTDAPAGSTVEITLKGRRIQLGGIHVGLSVNAGFTNLVFQNKYKDYSPYEKDQWGNITYIEGVKTNIHSGTVDVPIRHYDMMNRLMISLGQGLVILNGSDTMGNTQPDNQKDIFASTMVVGRIRDFALRTNLVNKSLGEMATYSFTIEEDV